MKIRPAAVSGLFYPSNPTELRKMLGDWLGGETSAAPFPKAIVAPHAGYAYSGIVAASAYRSLKPARGVVTRVVLLGPAHRVAFEGIAASEAESFETPFGAVPLDRESIDKIAGLPYVFRFDRAHDDEHGLEVHLPFLQAVLGNFSCVPLVVGEAQAEQVAEVLDMLWGDRETLIVVSSDLSHFLSYENAQQLDRKTAAAIETLQPESIGERQACGRVPLNGLLQVAARRGLRARTLDLRSSGDTAGSKDSVVGYGAFSFEEPLKA